MTTDGEMNRINEMAELTLKTALGHSKHTQYSTRAEIISGLRGDSALYVNKMYTGAWVSLDALDLHGFEYSDVFPEKITDVELNTEKTAVRATYGHMGYTAQMRYYREYVPYSGPYFIFCFTHFSHRGLGDISAKRAFNILRVPERTRSAGVVAYINLKKCPKIELWSRVSDRYQNEVVCFDTKICNYIDKIVYDPNYIDNVETNHKGEISYLQEKWGIDRQVAIERVRKLIFSFDEIDESIESLCDGIKTM